MEKVKSKYKKSIKGYMGFLLLATFSLGIIILLMVESSSKAALLKDVSNNAAFVVGFEIIEDFFKEGKDTGDYIVTEPYTSNYYKLVEKYSLSKPSYMEVYYDSDKVTLKLKVSEVVHKDGDVFYPDERSFIIN